MPDSRVRNYSLLLPHGSSNDGSGITDTTGSFAKAVAEEGAVSPLNGVDLMVPRLPPAQDSFTLVDRDDSGDGDNDAVAPWSSSSNHHHAGHEQATEIHDRMASHNNHGGATNRPTSGHSSAGSNRPSSSSSVRGERGDSRQEREESLGDSYNISSNSVSKGHGMKINGGGTLGTPSRLVSSSERFTVEAFDVPLPPTPVPSTTIAASAVASLSAAAVLGNNGILNSNLTRNTSSGSSRPSTPPVASRLLPLVGASLARVKGTGRASPSRGSNGSLSPAPADQRGSEGGGSGGGGVSPKKHSRRSSEGAQMSASIGGRKSTDGLGGVSHNFKVISDQS